MKILLINPVITFQPYALGFPINLVYLASGVRQFGKGMRAVPLDLTFERFNRKLCGLPLMRAQERCIEAVWREHGGFDAVGVSGLCDNFHLTLKISEFIKNRFKVPVIVGGSHATFLAREILEACPSVDFIIRHDGISPLVKLCQALARGSDPAAVPALTYRGRDGRIEQTEVDRTAPGILEVEPDYSVLPLQSYLRINRSMTIPVLAGSGCPFECSFCTTSLMWHRQYRVLDPKRISGLIAGLKAGFPEAVFSFVHDNLLINRKFALKLCGEMRKLGIRWNCSSRVEHIDDREFLGKLAASGCRSIFIGVETGSARMQRTLNKRVNVGRVLPLAKELKSAGIRPTYSLILGFPEETDSDRNETIRLAFTLRTFGANEVMVGLLSPLPGTKYARQPLFFSKQKRNLLLQDLINTPSLLRMIGRDPVLFGSFWRVKDAPRNTAVSPATVGQLGMHLAVHPLAFNYLFSKAGLLPTRLFKTFETKSQKRLHENLKVILPPRHYKTFYWLYRYESELMKLNAINPAASSRRAVPGEFDIDRRYRLAPGVSLLNIPLPASELFSGGHESSPSPRTYLIIINTGKHLNIYTAGSDLYKVLSLFRNNEARACSEMIKASLPGPAARQIVARLSEFHGAGAFLEVPEPAGSGRP